MKVKIFDETHEKDLEKSINLFLSTTKCDIINIQFTTAVAVCGEEQIYCFSAMILYKE
ncbi:MAG: sporulation protein Cse60 [Bacilli bacterium]|nr:sporulation protein Cse60 [Bacilli bacterium]